ncbi:hypothetical protein V6N12_002003 [Hibiscus sabdariffa]|uniref:Uncharacterized protein n=1 Tax=Hibiscus sabdariffa TaxID=183260 RepID=A0ABR1ZGJ7_9ROSI
MVSGVCDSGWNLQRHRSNPHWLEWVILIQRPNYHLLLRCLCILLRFEPRDLHVIILPNLVLEPSVEGVLLVVDCASCLRLLSLGDC